MDLREVGRNPGRRAQVAGVAKVLERGLEVTAGRREVVVEERHLAGAERLLRLFERLGRRCHERQTPSASAMRRRCQAAVPNRAPEVFARFTKSCWSCSHV